MRIAAIVSGGKDSLYAAYKASKEHEIVYIVSIISENPESYMFHVPNASLVTKQALSMGIPIAQRKTKGEKEKELNDLEKVLNILDIDGVVTGAVASNYQKERIDKLCEKLKIKSIAPLWGMNQQELLRSMIKDGFVSVIVSVAAPPLDESWLGRKIDKSCIDELIEINKKHGISVIGEGGEYDTFVTNCPLFKNKIEIVSAERHWDNKTQSGWLEIKKV